LQEVDWLVRNVYLSETKGARGGFAYQVLRAYSPDPFEVAS